MLSAVRPSATPQTHRTLILLLDGFTNMKLANARSHSAVMSSGVLESKRRYSYPRPQSQFHPLYTLCNFFPLQYISLLTCLEEEYWAEAPRAIGDRVRAHGRLQLLGRSVLSVRNSSATKNKIGEAAPGIEATSPTGGQGRSRRKPYQTPLDMPVQWTSDSMDYG